MITTSNNNKYNIATWIFAATFLFIILLAKLLVVLLSALLVHELVMSFSPFFMRKFKTSGDIAKVTVLVLVSALVITTLVLLGIGVAHFFQKGSDNLPSLFEKMAEILNHSKTLLPKDIVAYLPENIETAKTAVADWLKHNATFFKSAGTEVGRFIVHTLIGMIIGAMIALREVKKDNGDYPFVLAIEQRSTLLAQSFRKIIFAQTKISAINTILTTIYLMIILPLFGINLPFQKTIVALTFSFGLMPVVGNLLSNTIIIIVSLSASFGVAVVSLAFLVIIHKLEYFLNARIMGGHIKAAAYELLIVIVILESLFGIAGVVAAPIYYGYLKSELKNANIIGG